MKPRTVLRLLLALLLPAGAGAQVRPDTVPSPSDTTRAIPLAPIRVTVLRTPLRLSETPYAVTVERVVRSGPGLTLAEALGSVPGLQVDNRYNFSQGDRISVRGLGARAQFGVRGVKVLVDGIPATLPDGQTSLSHLDPRWVERAEVVRGPASSLWGNAAGGVIQLQTPGPPQRGAGGAVTALAGSHGLTHLGASAGWGSAPGDDGSDAAGVDRTRLGIRAAASRLLYDGFRDHAAADKRFASARGEWRGDRDAVSVAAHGVTYEASNPGSLSSDLLAADRTQAYDFNIVQEAGESAEHVQVGITWTRSLGSAELAARGSGLGGGSPGPSLPGLQRQTTSSPTLELSAWALRRELDNPIPPVIIDLSRWAAGVRASLRGELEVGGRTIDWVAGVDAEGQRDDRQNHENEGGERGALVLDQAERVGSVAPFVEATTPVAGPVRALAGLRYDRHRFTADDRLVTAGDPTTDDSGVRVMDQLSPSLGLNAGLGSASVYASVGSSFETPTTTELVNRPGGEAGFNPELEPQRAWSLEAGARTRLGDRVRMHVALYRTAIRDALIPFEVPSSPGRTFFRNAGSAVHRGLELDLWAALGAGVSARVGYALVEARFDDFVTPDGDRSGNRVPGVAPNAVNATLTWSRRGSRVAVEGRWVDAIPVDDANTATAPTYTILDVQGTSPALPLAGGTVEVFGGIDNLLDAEYVAAVVVNAFGGRYYEPGPGRTVYVGVRIGP